MVVCPSLVNICGYLNNKTPYLVNLSRILMFLYQMVMSFNLHIVVLIISLVGISIVEKYSKCDLVQHHQILVQNDLLP